MSENKKVIHVKDLVIKADNVYVEPSRPRHDHRHRDPFMGFRRGDHRNESSESAHEREHDHHESSEHGEDRGPFSWI